MKKPQPKGRIIVQRAEGGDEGVSVATIRWIDGEAKIEGL